MIRFRSTRPCLLSLLAAALAGCTASPLGAPDSEEGEENPGVTPSDDLPTSVDASGEACTTQLGRGVLRRLTQEEYRKSLVSLFESADVPADEPLSGNSEEHAYSTRESGLWVRDLSAQAISNHADAVAEWIADTNPSVVTSCAEQTPTCAEQTVRGFGRRAFQMPLSDAQVARYTVLFQKGADFRDALVMTVSTMIQSPYFVYRRELGTETGNAATLGDYELGSALSYMITGHPPDATLQGIIDAGSLRDETVWDAEVARLLETEEAESVAVQFLVEWLELDRVLSQTKTEGGVEVTESLRASMMGEVEALVRHVYRTGGGFRELVSGDSVFINAELAEHYGMSAPAGDGFQQVLAGDRTGGLLGTGAFLLGHSTVDSSSPTARGVFVRERLLCLEVAPPPPAVNTDLPVIEGPMTTRDRFSVHLSDPVCVTCHEQIDNFGFAFESYDGLGRHRTEENGLPIDSTGTTVGLSAGDVPFADSGELTSLLAASDQVERCFVQNFVEYTTGQPDWDNLCSVNQAMTVTSELSGSLKDVFRSVLSLPHFQARLSQGDS